MIGIRFPLGSRMPMALFCVVFWGVMATSCAEDRAPEEASVSEPAAPQPELAAQSPQLVVHRIAEPVVRWGEALEARARELEDRFMDQERGSHRAREVDRFIQIKGSQGAAVGR